MVNSRSQKITIVSSLQDIEQKKVIGFVINGNNLTIHGFIISPKSLKIHPIVGTGWLVSISSAEYNSMVDDIITDLKDGKIQSNKQYAARPFFEKYLKNISEISQRPTESKVPSEKSSKEIVEMIDENMQSDESTQKGTAFNLSGAVAVMSTIITSTIAPLFETTKQVVQIPGNNTISIQQPNPEIPATAIVAPILALIVLGSAVIGYCIWNRRRKSGEYDIIKAEADAEPFSDKEASINESSKNSSEDISLPTSELVDVVLNPTVNRTIMENSL